MSTDQLLSDLGEAGRGISLQADGAAVVFLGVVFLGVEGGHKGI